MDIKDNYIAYKKRIGTFKGSPVTEILLKGGLNLVAIMEKGKPKIIGAGPHRAVARWLAQKAEPELEISESPLEKSESVSIKGIQSVEEQYRIVAEYINTLINQ